MWYDLNTNVDNLNVDNLNVEDLLRFQEELQNKLREIEEALEEVSSFGDDDDYEVGAILIVDNETVMIKTKLKGIWNIDSIDSGWSDVLDAVKYAKEVVLVTNTEQLK